MRHWKLTSVMMAFGLALTACAPDAGDDPAPDTDADSATDTDESGETADASGESVTLVANLWPGSMANVQVAGRVLEEELGADVEIVEIDENAAWTGLDSGEYDAVLELWLSGHEDNYAQYVEDIGSVEDIGEIGVVGEIGWFLPEYVLEEYPEMETWEGIEGNEDVFATAETGDAGRFLAADPSFVQFDETIIENLDLNLEVVQSGSESAQLAEVQTALDQEEPVLFYFYTPHWMHERYDLAQVELPEYEEGCGEPEDERTCGYPEERMLKIVNADLSENAPVSYEFLENFQMENEWQDEITFMMADEGEGMDPEEAAQQWLDDNPDVVDAWLP
jgi:glycine betaine/proline transport system substrate-binding protein